MSFIDYRELGLSEIKKRIINNKDELNLKTLKRLSNDPIDKNDVNAIFIFEGVDNVTKHSSRGETGYPARRMLEVDIEIVAKNDRDGKTIKSLYHNVRRAIFCDKIIDGENIIYKPNMLVADNTIISELRTLGPGLYEIPELIGIKLVLGLSYIDNGILNI